MNFGDLSRSSYVKPARFVYNERNRVAQSSWVAGGYWDKSNMSSQNQNQTLSRSSSQSSGIGSLTSAAGLQASGGLPKDFLVSSLPNSRCVNILVTYLIFIRVLLRLEFQVAHPILNVTLATDQI